MIFDTTVAVYALLGVEARRQEAWEALHRADEIVVPDVFWPELTGVVARWIETRGLEIEHGLGLLADAEALITEVVPTVRLRTAALDLAVRHRLPVSAALFVAAAQARGSRVLSYDSRLREAFPDLVLGPAEYLAP